jgi:hypothetical protein
MGDDPADNPASPAAPDREIEALRQALLQAINQARVVNSLLYGARVRLESLPRAPDDALEIVRAFRADLDDVMSPMTELADRLIEALQKAARQG